MDPVEQVIARYYRLMQAMDPSFHWSDPDWWRDPSQARVVLTATGDGFAIIGYQAQVDPDVASEICELYCPRAVALLPLIRACLPHIRFPFGFQVLQVNRRAQRCFEGILRRLSWGFEKQAAMDGSSAVFTYRLQGSTHARTAPAGTPAPA